jgi:filamentous hemagglutinin family protein
MSRREAAFRTHHSFRRAALLASASAVALSMMGTAGHARNLLQGAAASSAPNSAASSAQIGAEQAAAAAQRAQRSITNATNLIRQNLTNQLNARNKALATPSGVPDGLVAGGLVPDNVATWSGLRAPVQTGDASNPTVTIEQTAASAIANWSSFNVGRNTILYFDQRGGNSPTGNSWAVLNRVIDPSAAPSQILGQIRAEGLVLVINRNGIIFGGSSQVNVGSLVASTLGITDTQFRTGIVNQQAFDTATNLANPAIFANTSGTTGNVTVEAGAVIQTAAPASVTVGGGSVFLFGANVTNNGVIYTPNGQTVLAAGTAAYITASIEPSVRGVQVIVENGGEARNTGYIGAPTGNISMYGMTVRQSGVLTASTSVNEAGSITLLAGDGLYTEATNHEVHIKRTGTVELSAGSLTAVLPEEDGLTASVGQPQPQSLIRLEGETVKLLGGSSIWAPGAKVALNATSNPANLYALDYAPALVTSSAADAGRVYIGDGALIDVAGLKLVQLAAAESAAKVNARGNEFRDSPLQRDGILAGKDVWVDVRSLITVAADRVYTPGGLLEVSGYLGLAQRNIDQRLTAAGSVSIFSTGDAIVRPGAFIDISGGSLLHQAGWVPGTRLIGADGRLYDINQAPADVVYVGVCCDFRVDHARWGVEEVYTSLLRGGARYQSEYIEGAAAGAISLTVRAAEFDASVDAGTVSGVYQRTAQSKPAGGSLTIGSAAGAGMLIQPNRVVIAPDVPAPDDVFVNSIVTGAFRDLPTPVLPSRVRDPNTLLSADRQQTLYLSAELLDQAGYGTININTQNGGIRVTDGARLQVAPGGAINLTSAGAISVDGSLTARAGAVALKAGSSTVAADIVLSAGALIDTRGLWVNDFLDGADASLALTDGGSVSLMASGNVAVGQGAVVDASSGGWVQANGRLKMSGDLPVGRGGDITLIADAFIRFNNFSSNTTTGVITNVPTTYPFVVTLDGTVRSYGFSRGGTLSIATPKIQIGGGAVPAGVMRLDPGFFNAGGFGRYALYGYQGITIAAGAEIQLHATTYDPVANVERAPTGTDVNTIATPTVTPAFRRAAPVDLILSAVDPFAGNLVMQQGASIRGEVGATIGLHATHQLTMDGVISAPAGSINIDLYGAPAPSDVGAVPPSNATAYAAPDFDPKQTLWIGPHAKLLAQGVVETYVDANGRIKNVIRGGGTVNINQDALHSLYYPYANYERTMNAPLGTVVAEAGAVIDVSGVSGTILLPSPNGLRSTGASPFDISTDGGAINIRASQGLLWAAKMNARGGGAAAAGGSLSIDQVGWGQPSNATNRLREPDYTVPVFELVISQTGTWMAPGLKLGDAVPSSLQGQMFIGVDQIEASGATSISLGGVDAVVFKGDVTLNAANRLTLTARNYSATPGATVTLNAPYVDIGSGQRTGTWVVENNNYIGQAIPAAVAGTAKLIVNANLIDIEGDLRSGAGYSYTSRYNGATAVSTAVSLPGFASMSFNSRGDIRLVTQQANNAMAGQLLTLGDLNFTAAQIYPTTGAASSSSTAFTIRASGPTSTINFARNSAETPPVPLSANGQVVIIAPTINQGGVLRAPMGQITFGDSANPGFSKVNLLPGSITSVSLEGSLIPYGQPAGALSYIYGYGGSTPNELVTTSTPQPPSKQISFFGSTVNVAGDNGDKPAAVINESGGGDLYGAQFVSGRQGSVDTLAGAQTFAILPSLGRAYAPRDPQMQRSDGGINVDATPVNLKVGDQVYLSGINGLPAGYYTLLPGHYALLPGGYKVTVAASQVAPSMLQNSAMPGGAYLVAGYRANANTGQRDQLGSQFVVTPGDVVRKLSQYDETTVSQFFQKQAAAQNLAPPALAQDAGRLVIQVTSGLIFQGRGDFSVGVGGRGGQADIVGTNLAVIGDGDLAPTGFVGLTDTALNAIGAQSLLIGGLRNTPFSNRNQITITPSAAAVEIGGHARLAAPEIMLVASGTITLDPGARIDTTAYGAIADRFPTDPATGLSLGQIVISTTSGAFLMASNATPLSVSRASVTASTSSLNIGAGAGVYARSSLILNDTNTMSINPTARFAAPTVNAGAAVINVGTGASTGFTITDELLKVLSQGDASRGLGPTTNLILSASQSINLYGSASLGTIDPATGEYSVAGLTLNAPLIQGIGTAGDVARIAAGNVTLQGAAVAGTGSAGQGRLQVSSANLTLGPGALALAGFSTVTLTGTAQVAGKGTGVIGVAGDLTVSTSRLTGNARADTTLTATGAVKLDRSAPTGTATSVNSLGAHLTVIGQTIEQNTDIEIASGVVNLTGRAGVTLDAGSIINVAGGATTFYDVVRIAPGGTVNLTAQNGNVDIQSGARVDVSGTERTETAGIDPLSSDKGGDAGTLNIVATNGTATLGGIFNTGTVDGYKGAQVSLDLGSGDAGTLLAAIAGFRERQALTLRTGDMIVGNVTAHDVELSATTGNLTVLGAINASGVNGGIIRLAAGLGKNLTIGGTALLDAHATSASGSAASVFLGTGVSDTVTSGRVLLASGATIDVSGGIGNGKVTIRAPRVGSSLVGVSDGGVIITGAREVDVEAVAVTDITSNPFVDQALVAADAAAQAYMANAAAIKAGIGSLATSSVFHLMAGIELRSSGDMTLMQNPTSANPGIDLHNLRYNGEAAVLTLRAAGNLNINASLSDGFFGPVAVTGNDPVTGGRNGAVYALAAQLPSGSRSWSLRLVGGADLTGTDPLALLDKSALASGKGSIVFNDPRLDQKGYPIPSVVRTGTGDLDLAAAADISLLSQFGIYTAGTAGSPANAPSGFTAPTRPFIPTSPGKGPNSILGYSATATTTTSPNNFDNAYPTAFTPNYPENGGNITVRAKGNLTGAAISPPTVAPGNNSKTLYGGSEIDTFWLWTQETPVGGVISNGTWYINFGAYYQAFTGGSANLPATGSPRVAAFVGLGALGGGNASVSVGGDMTNVDVAVPTTGRLPGRDLSRLVVTGGGNLDVAVGGTINNANFLVGRGVGTVRAADIGSTSIVNLIPGDAQLSAYADRNINVAIGDPTRVGAIGQTVAGSTPIGLEGVTPANFQSSSFAFPYGYFTTYTERTALNTFAAGGDISLTGSFGPPIMEVIAANGSINGTSLLGLGTSGFHTLPALPAVTAQIDFLAGRNINNVGVSMTGVNLALEAAPTTYAAVATILNFADLSTGATPSNLVQFDDPRTVHIYAVAGDIVQPGFATSKRTSVRAGRDIVAPLFYLQNSDRDPAAVDVSSIQAGRDITSFISNGSHAFNIRMGGPGYLEVQAGRDLFVSSSANGNSRGTGIATIGNTDNVLLPKIGAAIGVSVGVGAIGPRNTAFIDAYLDPATAGATAALYAFDLIDYVHRQKPALTALAVSADDFSKLTSVQQAVLVQLALSEFEKLPAAWQAPLIQKVYFAEIRAGGQAAAAGEGAGGKGFDRAYRAIQTLFPGTTIGARTTAYDGNLSLYQLARIRTEAGGDINLLAPGGDIVLGFENQTPNLAGQKDTARPGLLTLRGGGVNTFSDGDAIVAQSRVFTELGGDIVMWSTNADVNAGKGKKTSLVTSPPQFTLDPYANVTKSPSTPQTGAGIAALQGVPGVKQGDVFLFAPHGTVDAGDASIRGNDVTIGALLVLNADNIQAAGKTVGIPTVQAPNTTALVAADNAAGAASKAMESQKPADSNQNNPSVIIVEVLGYGGGEGDPDDRSLRKPDQRSYNSADPIRIVGYGSLNQSETQGLTAEEQQKLSRP